MEIGFWTQHATIAGVRWDLSYSNDRLLMYRGFRIVMSLEADGTVVCHDKDGKVPNEVIDAWMLMQRTISESRRQQESRDDAR